MCADSIQPALARWHLEIILAATICGAVLRLVGLTWDQGLLFHPDERNLVVASADLTLEGGWQTTFYAYNGLALIAPRLLANIFFWTHTPTWEEISFAARLLSATLSTVAVWIGAHIALRLGGAMAGVAAAVLLATSAALIQWGHFGTTESALCLIVLLLWRITIAFEDGALSLWTAAVAIGLTLGIGLGFKTSAGAFAVIPAAAMLLHRPWLGLSIIGAGAVSATLAIAILLATTPGIVLDFQRYLDVMAFEGGVVAGTNDVFWTYQFFEARTVFFELSQLAVLLGFAVPLAALGAFRAGQQSFRLVTPVFIFAALYFAIISGWHAKFVRYQAPYVPLLLVFAGIGAARLLQDVRSRAAALATALALLIAAVSGLTFAASYLAEDPRIAVTGFVREQVRPDDTVLIEPSDVWDYRIGEATVEVLPVLEPSSPDKLTRMSALLGQADWLVLNSRRHWSVLPRMTDRFREMCGYYSALLSGDLGYDRIKTFGRARAFRGLWRQNAGLEETLFVFDRPTTHLFLKTRPLSQDDMRALIDRAGQGCDPAAVIDQMPL